MFRRWGIFRGLLISYIVITLIPVGVFLYITVNSITNTYQANIIESRSSNLRRVSQTLDQRIRECKNLAIQFSSNQNISKYHLSSPYSGYVAIRELSKMKETNEFLSDVGVYYHGGEYLYSSRGATEMTLAFTSHYNIDEEEADALCTRINVIGRPVVISARDHSRAFYFVPLPVNYSYSYGVAMFLFEQNAMTQLFENNATEAGDYQLWVNDAGEVLYASGQCVNLTEEECLSMLTSDRIQLADGSYHVLREPSQVEPGLNAILLLKESNLAPLFDGFFTILAALTMVLIICLALATWFSSRYWQPIRELGALLREGVELNTHWEPIQIAVRNALTQNEELADQLSDHLRVMRENLGLRLIQGQNEQDEDLRTSMEDLGYDGSLRYGCIITVMARISGSGLSQRTVEFMEREYPDRSCTIEVGIVDCVVIAYFLMDDADYLPVVRDVAERIADMLADEHKDAVAIGIGRAMPLNQLRWSYLQAMAVQNKDVGISAGIRSIEDTVVNARLMPELNEKEMIMTLAIRQGNAPLARQMIDEMINYSLSNAPSVYSYTCYCLLNRVMQVHGENPALTGALNLDDAWRSLSRLIEGSMPDEFKRQIGQVVESITREILIIDEKREGQYVRLLIEYIEQNYLDKDFSLDMLAQEFGSSSAYWSRFFKDKLGCNFSEYVWQLRLREAKRLLEETDLAVKEIVDCVGYLDTRSFIRKFKNSEGITPGQYKTNRRMER